MEGIGAFIHGKLNGEHKTFYKSGMLEGIVYFKDSVPEGKVVRFYENGNKRSDATYKNGLIVREDLFYESGKVKSVTFSENDKLVKSSFYDEGGLLISEETLKDGALVNRKEFNSDGVLLDEQEFNENGNLKLVKNIPAAT